MFVQFWLFIVEAFLKKADNLFQLGFVEGVERVDEGIRKYEIAKAREGLIIVHPNQKDPS